MTLRARWSDWRALDAYERFEQVVVYLLTLVLAVIVLASLWSLLREVVGSLVLSALDDPLGHGVFQRVFGMIFTVIIALEFKRSLLVVTERHFSLVQVRSVILIALLAVVRKVIILDLATTPATKVFALGAAILALGAVYWLVRDQDRIDRDRAEGRGRYRRPVAGGKDAGGTEERHAD